ncbi:MAG TPA: hypothetical protein VM889_04815 [Candidatus Thermoplasmatota archaeon]|nr:hypothetical protein [Candidatus Thermoplasmatota archaeon]
MTEKMTESKTRPISLRVREDVLAALEKAGLSATEIARAALEAEATRARRKAVVQSIRQRRARFELGFDGAAFIRKERDRHD